mmetsp:Transcript_15313/g.34216  ORF Transcript_15313/g.34216 Transcript_15313/m.34216 type:complete len:314 (-) Transcript_15313:46-987(-)
MKTISRTTIAAGTTAAVSAIAGFAPCSSAFVTLSPTVSTRSTATSIASPPSPTSASSTTLYIDNFLKRFNENGPEDEIEPELDKQGQKQQQRLGGIDSFLNSMNQGQQNNGKKKSMIAEPEPEAAEKIESYVNAVKTNVLSGEFGERGEQYVIAQFGLLLCIAIGTVPYFGDILALALGPALIGGSLVIVYRAAADLGTNLSPWPVPADPSSDDGSGSLIDTGIYSYVRHPMYSGLILGMAGLSMATDSATRLLLTIALYFVLDAKADFEEAKLIQTYGDEYVDYMFKVKGKLIPNAAISLLRKKGEADPEED